MKGAGILLGSCGGDLYLTWVEVALLNARGSPDNVLLQVGLDRHSKSIYRIDVELKIDQSSIS